MLARLHPSDITLLRVFRLVCESGGIAAAAERHGTSASTLSTQLIQLEQRLALKLCKRGRGGFAILPEGEIVLRLAHSLFDEMQAFVHGVSELEDSLVGELRIGIVDNTIGNPDFDLGAILRAFHQRFPHVKATVEICRPEELEEAVLDGKYDVGVGAKESQLAYLEYWPLYGERQVVCCGREHPFFEMPDRQLTSKQLRNSDWVVDHYRFPLKYPDVSSPHRLTLVSSIEAGLHMVLTGGYVGALPLHYVSSWIARGKVRVLLESELSHSLEFFAFHNPSQENVAIVSRFWSFLSEKVED